jgi:hypothetical protein
MRRAGHVARVEERRSAYRVWVGKYERKRPLERLTRRWEDNIKKRILKNWDGGIDWIVLAENRDRVVGFFCECSNEHSDSVNYAGNFLTSWGPVSFSGRTRLHGVSLLITNFVVMNRSSLPLLWIFVLREDEFDFQSNRPQKSSSIPYVSLSILWDEILFSVPGLNKWDDIQWLCDLTNKLTEACTNWPSNFWHRAGRTRMVSTPSSFPGGCEFKSLCSSQLPWRRVFFVFLSTYRLKLVH